MVPPEEAGVQVGDIVLAVNGTLLRKATELPQLVGRIRPGTPARFLILRNGERMALRVVIGDRGEDETAELPDEDVSNVPQANMQLKAVDEGVEVTQIGKGIGRLLGLRVGDVITHINNRSVSTPDEVSSILTAARSGQYISARVLRGNGSAYVTTRVP